MPHRGRIRMYGTTLSMLVWICIVGLLAYAFAFHYSESIMAASHTYRPVVRIAQPDNWSIIFTFLGLLVAVCGLISRPALGFATLVVGLAMAVWGGSVVINTLFFDDGGILTAGISFCVFAAVNLVTSWTAFRGG